MLSDSGLNLKGSISISSTLGCLYYCFEKLGRGFSEDILSAKMSIDLSCPYLQPEHHTYSYTFLTACPVCKTVNENLRIHLNEKVSCVQCTSIFTAHENFIDVEDSFSDTIPSKVRLPEETEVSSKEKQEGETRGLSDEKHHNDFARPKSPIDNQRELKNVRKEALRNLLAKRRRSIEAERTSSKGQNEDASANEGKKGVMENEGQHTDKEGKKGAMKIKDQCTDKGVDLCEGLIPNFGAKVSTDGSKGARGSTKSRKGKCGRILGSRTWGVALRKVPREKKRVRSCSPPHEHISRKKVKLGLEKGGKANDDEHTFSKKKIKQDIKKGGKVNKIGENLRKSKGKGLSAGKGKVGNDRNTPEKEKDKIVKSDPEGFSNEFKLTMTEEIRRQVLEGLGEASKAALGDVQVVDVEQIRLCMPTTGSILDTEGVATEDQRYIAKVKLMATLCFPLTLRASQEPPRKWQEPMELHEPRQPRVPEEPESKGIEEPEEHESKGREEPEEHESKGLEEELQSQGENGEELNVPESKFYDFGCDRSEDKFANGQVWALYDRKDGMPRDYVQIKKVMSINPFKVQVALLEPRDHPVWVKAGNSLTCGDYVTDGRLRVMDHIDGFSHMMKWEKGHGGMVGIYPAEGDVWALYNAWMEIDSFTRIKSGYEIVQVATIKKEDCTVSVVPLVKYGGHSTVFIQRAEMERFEISKRYFTRFSHQIPTYELLGAEGRLELDPASTPLSPG